MKYWKSLYFAASLLLEERLTQVAGMPKQRKVNGTTNRPILLLSHIAFSGVSTFGYPIY
jgi:hypothetical protein